MHNLPLVRNAGITMWRQIEQALRDDILSGQLQHRLPNEAALAQRFCVNRHTVRQAVKALADHGLVDIRHGSGTFVRDDMIDYQVGRRSRLAHSVASARRVGASRVLSWQAVPASPEVSQLLDLPAGAEILCVESLDVVDGKVIGVCSQYFPLPRFAGLGELYAHTGVTHLALAHYGVLHFQRRMSRITARLPDLLLAQQLAQAVSLPVLHVETVYVDDEGVAIEYGISRFCSAAVQVVVAPD